MQALNFIIESTGFRNFCVPEILNSFLEDLSKGKPHCTAWIWIWMAKDQAYLLLVILVHTRLVDADTTIFSHFLWAKMEGCTNTNPYKVPMWELFIGFSQFDFLGLKYIVLPLLLGHPYFQTSNVAVIAALLFYNLVHALARKRKLHLFDPTISFAIPLKVGRSYVPLHFHYFFFQMVAMQSRYNCIIYLTKYVPLFVG